MLFRSLRAPADGVIASANAVAGQVVAAQDTLFEIVDPHRLMVEAQSPDAALACAISRRLMPAPLDLEKARGILLVGPRGAGKSAVAAKIAHDVLKEVAK